jgi:adenylosuccinate lyase
MTQAPNIFLSARTQLNRLALGQVSAADLLEEHVARYQAANPAVNAVVRTDLETARARAGELDRMLKAGTAAGPLHGLPMTEMLSLALAPHLGRAEAFALVEKAARDVGATGRSLSDVVKADAAASVLTGDEIDRILDPLNALGATQAFIESALAQWEESKI